MISDYVALDLETTGLNPASDRILEIGAVRIKGGQVEASYSTLVDCVIPIPKKATEITGISNETLQKARSRNDIMTAEAAVEQLIYFCEGLPLLGHQILFDYCFIRQAAANMGREFKKEGVDTLRIARKYLPHLPSKSLESLCTYYKIEEQHHRALADARAAAALYGRLAEEFDNGEKEDFLPQEMMYRVKKQSPATKFQKAYLIDLIKYHRIDLDVSIDSLTRSEASRMTDQILSAYGKIKR